MEREMGMVLKPLVDGAGGLISTEQSDIVHFMRTGVYMDKDGGRPNLQIGDRVSFIRSPVTKLDPRTGNKLRDNAIDVRLIK